ncbi:MAG: recombination mediator RecR [Firmicutes bacterium]|nr:recombination mediator RecR [[Eubacterium] siraeum]MCM1488478.1 recombination mediator RecR [Bacillota bacterium]
MAEYNPLPLLLVSEQLAKLPGIGMKTAGRLAYHILNMPIEEVENFSDTILRARKSVNFCKVCQNFTEEEICSICGDDRRNHKIICVVESPKDLSAFERAGGFDGVYHVLHGLLSPAEGITPDDLRIRELMSRLGGDAEEVIMATNPTIEGETTASYISRLIKPLGIKVTRLAYGLPAGSTLEYADEVTLQRALENRNEF